jgi:hypothetical protein
MAADHSSDDSRTRRHTCMRVDYARPQISHDFGELRDACPEPTVVAVKEVDRLVRDARLAKASSIRWPISLVAAPSGRHDRNRTMPALGFAESCDCSTRAAPEKWDDVKHRRSHAQGW